MRRVTRRSRPLRRGTSLLELLVVAGVVLVAVTVFAGIVESSSEVRALTRERGLAAEASRKVLERMRNEPLDHVFALYNRAPDDDPGGPGTAPGHRFHVRGLDPVEGAPDGMVGEVVFPAVWQELDDALLDDPEVLDLLAEEGLLRTLDGALRDPLGGGAAFAVDGLWMLREDANLPELGMPRDLNGDGRIDSTDHRYDALAVPVLVRVDWSGRHGERTLAVAGLLTDFAPGVVQ